MRRKIAARIVSLNIHEKNARTNAITDGTFAIIWYNLSSNTKN